MQRIANVGIVFGAAFFIACGGASSPPAAPVSGGPVAAAPASPPQNTAPAPVNSPSATAAPSPTPAAQVQALAAAWSAHDADKIASLYAEGATLRVPGLPDMTGREAIKAQARQSFAGSADLKITPTRAWVHGNTAAGEWVATATDTGGQNGAKPTNRPTGLMGMSIFVFGDDGLIKSDHRYFDMVTQASQLDPKAKAGTFRPVVQAPTVAMEAHASTGAASEQADVATVKAMYDAIDAHKVDGFLAHVSDDVTMDDYSQPVLAKGKKDAKAYVDGFLTAFPDLKQSRDLQIAADGYVVTEGVLTGTNKGKLGSMKASNKPVTMHFVDVLQTKDGKVIKGWSYGNNVELLTQIGAMPPMGAK